MRGRERENITGFVFFGSRRILQAGGFQSFESLFGVFLLLFCPSCLEKETLFLLLQVEKHHPTKNCILIAATKVTPPGDPKKASLLLQTQETPPRDKKKTASLLLQIQETPPRDQKKNCILVAANS
jgi:hypothetical protein